MVDTNFERWPERDRQLWLAARTAASILDKGGRASNWRLETVRMATSAYTAWIKYLDQRGELSADDHPATRITTARIKCYVEHLRTNMADATVSMHLHHLFCIVQAMSEGGTRPRSARPRGGYAWTPGRDRRTARPREKQGIAWLDQVARRILATAKPKHPKAPRLVDSTVLLALDYA
jgi:hypothetical protein